MADRAQVSSIDALEAFRARLIVYLKKANGRIDEVSEEIRRTKAWLANDRRLHWQMEIRRRRTILDRAEAELLTAKFSGLRDNLLLQQAAVRKAKAALDEAEGKLLKVRQWTRNFESAVDPLWRKLESLRGIFEHEIPAATAYLSELQRILEGYTETFGAPSPLSGQGPAEIGPGAAAETAELSETEEELKP